LAAEDRSVAQIFSMIADWPRLLRHQQVHGGDFGRSDEGWYRANGFHHWNDSYIFNTAVGELFIDLRGQLPAADAARIGEFLAAVCPAVADEGPYSVPTAEGVFHEKFYAALPPAEVDRRLAGLIDADWVGFVERAGAELARHPSETLSGRGRDVSEFLFMWAAAFGAASSKGWGLLVVID
jgi:hypothetical protein